ncbi:MAG: hypothetical protein ACRC7N_17690 [Clostridium sp.]
MANYRPFAVTIANTVLTSGASHNGDAQFTEWGLALLFGTAIWSNTQLGSIAILIWESTAPTTGNPTHTTFTDPAGKFGVTVSANKPLTIKAFAK